MIVIGNDNIIKQSVYICVLAGKNGIFFCKLVTL